MTRLSICLVGAALAAAACGDDATTDDASSSSGGGTSTGSTTTGANTGATSSGSASSSTGEGGEGQGGSAVSSGAGGEGGSGAVPPFRLAVDMADEPLAIRALQIVGADIDGAEAGCLPCHALTEGNLASWNVLTNEVLGECLTDLEVSTQESAIAMIECVKARNGVEGSEKFATPALGFWAAGAKRDWWKYTFQKAYPADGEARYQAFLQQVKMPPNAQFGLDEGEYDIVGEWFVRGAPLLAELLDEDPGPGECEPLVTPATSEYVASRQVDGWRSLNASNGMLMFGCEADEAPLDCLSSEPAAPDAWLVEGEGSIKVLAEIDYDTSFWTRGSSDGRFVGSGAWTGPAGAAIVDLRDERVIPVNASYDPAFFPDDAGFVFQGGNGNVCRMDVLTSAPDQITMTEPGCSSVGEVGLYQHVGASLGGGDYFAVDGPFVSDDGGHAVTLGNPESFFGNQSSATLIPMLFNGTTFEAVDRIHIDTPFDGDAVISPSAGLLVSRTDGSGSANSGYHLRRVDAQPDGQGSFDVETTSVGRYCISGGKPAFSFDERWIVLHHYIENTDEDAIELGFTGKSDVGFAPYRNQGGSNIYLIDLVSGEQRRITRMPAGRYALFPFFRSDGWIYFISRTAQNNDGENIMASDAALRAEEL